MKADDPDKLRIAISGASGMIGSALSKRLLADGHTVLRLVRTHEKSDNSVYWNIDQQVIDAASLEGVDAVVHLAGESVFALRWTGQKKRRILDSRVKGTRLLAKAVASLTRKPSVFVSASAIGIYGNDRTAALTETSPTDSSTFLAKVCAAWESESTHAKRAGIRTVNPRIGIVLSPDGGMLKQMLTPFRMGLGGRIGARDQVVSWVAIDDVVGALYHAILNEDVSSGPMNVTAPKPVTMEEFTSTLASVLNRPSLFAIPAPLIRMATGSVADELILASQRITPEVLTRTNYEFRHTHLEPALRALLA